jgi:hypothetical protein
MARSSVQAFKAKRQITTPFYASWLSFSAYRFAVFPLFYSPFHVESLQPSNSRYP